MGLFGSEKKIDPKELEKEEIHRSTSYLRAFSIYFNAEMGTGDYREAQLKAYGIKPCHPDCAPISREMKQLYKNGMKAYNAKDYENALPLLTKADRQGHRDVQFYCGLKAWAWRWTCPKPCTGIVRPPGRAMPKPNFTR